MKLNKFFDRIGEKLQMWYRKYEYPILVARDLTDEESDLLQFLTEHPVWEVMQLVRDQMNEERNKRAIGFCDGRTFVEFKKMEATNEYLACIEEIVKQNKKKQAPAITPEERPRKIAEYVPR